VELITLDFETFYDAEYSLSKLNTEAYIRDPRFEAVLASIKFNNSPAFWLLPDRLDHFLRNEVDWSDTAVLHHHAHFDAAILSWRYGVRPAMICDTLSMARVIDGPKAGNSLHDLCERHGLPAKGDYVTYAKGKHGADFSAAEIHAYGDYCCNDAERTYQLAQIFLPQIPESEVKLIDLVIRMFTEPVLIGDEPMLAAAVASERARKAGLLERIGATAKVVGSNEQFADLLLCVCKNRSSDAGAARR